MSDQDHKEHATAPQLGASHSSADEREAPRGLAPAGMNAGLLQRKIQRRALARKAGPGGAAAGADAAYGGVIRSVAVAETALVGDAAKPKDTEIAKLKKGNLVEPTDLGVGAPANKELAGTGKAWWKVKAIGGEHHGQEGWVVSGELGSTLEVKGGKDEYSGKVGDGTVTIGSGRGVKEQTGDTLGDDMFSLEYKGKDASEARWLQFIWREVIGLDDKGAASPVKDSITTSGGTYQLTEGGTATANGTPGKVNYNTDSLDKSNPFYESGGVGDRTADSASMFDQPYGATDKAQDAFRNGAKRVISRAHFSTFLVRNKKVTFKTGIHINWTFNRKEDTDGKPKGAHTVTDSGAADALPATIAERFHEQYPAHKDIK